MGTAREGRHRFAGATIGVCVGGRKGNQTPAASQMGVGFRTRPFVQKGPPVPGSEMGGGGSPFPIPSCRPHPGLAPMAHGSPGRAPASSPPRIAVTAGAHPSPTTTHLMACICPGSAVGWDGGARLPSSASFAMDAARSRSERARKIDTESRPGAGRGRGERRGGRRDGGREGDGQPLPTSPPLSERSRVKGSSAKRPAPALRGLQRRQLAPGAAAF